MHMPLRGGILTHASVVVQVDLNIALDDATKGADEVVDLAGVGAADGVSNTDTVHTNAVDRLVNREQVDEVGTERIFRREPNLNA